MFDGHFAGGVVAVEFGFTKEGFGAQEFLLIGADPAGALAGDHGFNAFDIALDFPQTTGDWNEVYVNKLEFPAGFLAQKFEHNGGRVWWQWFRRRRGRGLGFLPTPLFRRIGTSRIQSISNRIGLLQRRYSG